MPDVSDKAIERPSSIVEAWETIKKLDTKKVSDWITLFLKIMGGYGAFLLFAYSAQEHFFYDLSSLAAVSLLLLVAFGFSLLLAAGALYGAVSLIWIPMILIWVISWITHRRRRQPNTKLRTGIPKWLAGFSVFMFLLLGSLIIAGASKQSFSYPLLLWFASTGFIVAFLIAAEPANPTSGGSTHKELLLLPAVPFLVLFMSGSFGFFLDRAMILLSFRSGPDQYVTLAEQSYRKVDALSHAAGIQVSACELRKDFWLLKGVILVWHGIGATSYLRITGKPAQTLLIPLPSTEVDAIHTDSPTTVGDCAASVRSNVGATIPVSPPAGTSAAREVDTHHPAPSPRPLYTKAARAWHVP
jgi:hypothetical protein